MSLQKARELARAYHHDPQRFEQQVNIGTFKEVAEQWFQRYVVREGLRTQDEIKRHLTRYVYPAWGNRKFLEIRRGEVNVLLDHIEDNHGAAQANAVLSTVRSIMNWHQKRNDHYTSPIVRGMQRCKNESRDRILSDDELQRIWNVAGDSGQFGAFVKMCLLTAQRQGKVTAMRWNDIVEGVWVIPKEKREKGTGGRLKLPDAALAVLAALPRFGEYIFPAGRGNGPFRSHYDVKPEFDKRAGVSGWTLHDLRRTARSLMARAGVQRDVAERVLGHAIGGVEEIYDRHDYTSEKGAAPAKLANLIESIVNPTDNVVPLRAR
jgi:integrase